MPGTLLWNLQTQKPEYIPAERLESALASGTYREYSGSGATRASTGGVIKPQELAASQAAGVQTSELARAEEAAKQRHAAAVAAHDNLGDEVLTALDGAVNTASLGIITGIGDEHQIALREEANPYARAGGALVTALAAMKVPGLGLASPTAEGATAAGELVEGKVLGGAAQATARRQALAKAAGLGTSGAIEGAAYAAGSQINNAIHGRPVSGDAIVDGIGLGGLLGGAGGFIGARAGLSRDAAAAARKDTELVSGLAGAEGASARQAAKDMIGVYGQAHADAMAKLEALENLASRGAMGETGEVTETFLKSRRAAAAKLDKAYKRMLGTAGAKDVAGVQDRLEQLIQRGDPKEIEKFLHSSLVEYPTAVTQFDEVFRPDLPVWRRMLDQDVKFSPGLQEAGEAELGQLETTGTAKTRGGPAQEAGTVRGKAVTPGAEPQVPVDEFGASTVKRPRAQANGEGPYRYSEAYNEGMINAEGRGFKGPPEVDSALDKALGRMGAKRPRVDYTGEAEAVKEVAETQIAPEAVASPATKNIRARGVVPEAPRTVKDALAGLQAKMDAVLEKEAARAPTQLSEPPGAAIGGPKTPGGRPQYLDALDFWHKVNREAGQYIPSPQLGSTLDAAMQRLEGATGGRLNSPALRALAEELGVNTTKLQGTAAEKVLNLWSLGQMAKGLAAEGTPAATGRSFAGKALRNAASNLAGFKAFAVGGPVAGSLARTAVSSALDSVGALSRLGAGIKNKVVNGLALALNPKAVRSTLRALPAVAANYNPNDKSGALTRDFRAKMDQLSRAMGTPEATRAAIRRNLDPIRAIDPAAAKAAEDSAMNRMQNLKARMPVFVARGMGILPALPPRDEQADFELYEAITHDPELALKLAQEGRVSQTVVDAITEQHPEFRDELTKYVLEPETTEMLKKAPMQVQASLGRLLGVPIVPEADPAYVQRQQLEYEEEKRAKQASEQQRQAVTGGAGQLGNLSPTQLPFLVPTVAGVYSTPPPVR